MDKLMRCKDCQDHGHGCFGSGKKNGLGYSHCVAELKNNTKPKSEFAALRAERDDLATELTRVNRMCNALRAEVDKDYLTIEEWKRKNTKLESDLAAAVGLISKMRGQWIHTMHKDECLALLARLEVK